MVYGTAISSTPDILIPVSFHPSFYGSFAPDIFAAEEEIYITRDDEWWHDASWEVINAYFNEKGLVRQQLDSFNEFSGVTMQEIITDSKPVEVEGKRQHTSNELEQPVSFLTQPS